MTDPLKPSAALLCKLGSALVHMEELHSKKGHVFDRMALNTILDDEELQLWMCQMREMAMLPVKR